MSMRNLASLLRSQYGSSVLTWLPKPALTSPFMSNGMQYYSTKPSDKTNDVKRVVFISQSTNIFANLAFEDWIYKNWVFEKRNILFLWKNSPCVVIGRHQNPYVEANLEYLRNAGVPLARRNSGGGTVYHDEGNLNCTFFTARDRYNRKENLDVICRALQEDFGIQAEPNERDDIIIGDHYKISGSAAKLGRSCAYHHCTLLVRTDKKQLRLALQGDKSIQSKATSSVPAPVMNLCDSADNFSTLSVEQLLSSIGRKYLEGPGKDSESTKLQSYQMSNGYTLINPTDDWFPGLAKLEAHLTSNEWLYNKTPRFTITRPVQLPECVAHNTSVNMSVQAYHGMIEDLKVEDTNVCSEIADLIHDVGQALKGTQYTTDFFHDLANRLRLPQSLRTQRSMV